MWELPQITVLQTNSKIVGTHEPLENYFSFPCVELILKLNFFL